MFFWVCKKMLLFIRHSWDGKAMERKKGRNFSRATLTQPLFSGVTTLHNAFYRYRLSKEQFGILYRNGLFCCHLDFDLRRERFELLTSTRLSQEVKRIGVEFPLALRVKKGKSVFWSAAHKNEESKIMIYVRLYLIYMLLKDDFLILFIIQLRSSIVKWNRKMLFFHDASRLESEAQYQSKCRRVEDDYDEGKSGDTKHSYLNSDLKVYLWKFYTCLRYNSASTYSISPFLELQ